MVHVNGGDHGQEWVGYVGCVPPSTQADLEDSHIHFRPFEMEKGHCGGKFKICQINISVPDVTDQQRKFIGGDRVSTDSDPFGEAV